MEQGRAYGIRGDGIMHAHIKKLKRILIKSGFKSEEVNALSDIEVQKVILNNFAQVQTCEVFRSQEKVLYILEEDFEKIKKYNEVIE